MKVILKRNFVANGSRRFRKSANQWDVREIPDELCFSADGKRRFLPKDAVIVDGPVAPAPVEAEVTLRDLDADRAASDAAVKAAQEAEAEDAAADFKRKLALEKAAEGSREAETPAQATKNRKPKR